MAIAKLFSMTKWFQFVFGCGAFVGATVGALGGIGLGIVVGMLTAPKEGKQLREDLNYAMAEGKNHLAAKGQKLTEKASAILREAANSTESSLDDIYPMGNSGSQNI